MALEISNGLLVRRVLLDDKTLKELKSINQGIKSISRSLRELNKSMSKMPYLIENALLSSEKDKVEDTDEVVIGDE